MEFKFSKGDRVVLTLGDKTSYEGDVKTFHEESQMLTLKNITHYPRGTAISGLRHFEVNEIANIKLIADEDSSADEKDDQEQGFGKNWPFQKSKKISDAVYNKILDLQNSFRLINSASKNFYCAITLLQKSDIIGLSVEDTSKGRQGRASVIAVATESNVFVFDIEKLGDKLFDKGLRKILESESIVKVVYDCRLLSDCLYHKHRISLANVRDVEAEDVIMVHQERGGVRRHTRSFNYLTELYLGITSETDDESSINESWNDICNSKKLQKVIVNKVSLLIPLHKTIQDQYLQRLIDASKIYNEIIRDSDIYEYVLKDNKYVAYDEMVNLIKYKSTCRGIKPNS